ncbi:hypothetical protein V8C86DRAFT_2571254, partial [Haematococcus lacustris]
MLREQEDEDDVLAARLSAELATAREAAAADKAAALQQLQQRLDAAQATAARLQQEAEGWEAALALKEKEAANLQLALGEMSWESEAAERLRLEVRTLSHRLNSLACELEAAKGAAQVQAQARAAAEEAAAQ